MEIARAEPREIDFVGKGETRAVDIGADTYLRKVDKMPLRVYTIKGEDSAVPEAPATSNGSRV